MHLKYLTLTQTLEIVYEGQARRFSLASVSVRPDFSDDPNGNFVAGFETLSLDSPPQLWTVGWDTSVFIVNTDTSRPQRANDTNKFDSSFDDYTSVGGLEKQIDQIRNLLELPLTCPELFQYFGSYAHKLPCRCPTQLTLCSDFYMSAIARSQATSWNFALRAPWYRQNASRASHCLVNQIVSANCERA